jgi:macrodomain Ter protein organizer (MatP/YcbG family)
MPNKRDRNKRIVNVFLDNDLKKALAAEAKRRGKTVTDLITEFADEITRKTKTKKTKNK